MHTVEYLALGGAVRSYPIHRRLENHCGREVSRDTRKQGFPGHFKELVKELTMIIRTVRNLFSLKPENIVTRCSAVIMQSHVYLSC